MRWPTPAALLAATLLGACHVPPLVAPAAPHAAFATAVGESAVPTIYSGPCDDIIGGCAEAYSLTHAMTRNYTGKLFQLVLATNTSITLDIGQNSDGQADMTTWSAFCGGVESNCLVSKIYAQIQGHSNDLVPSTFNAPAGPNCSTGSAYQCAPPFALNTATGLPEVTVGINGWEFTIPGDAGLTGVPAGSGSDVTVILSGGSVEPPGGGTNCCGTAGKTHCYNCGDVPGQDFTIAASWSSGGAFMNCPNAGTFCLGLDIETQYLTGGNLGPSPVNFIAMSSWNHTTNYITGAINGKTVFYTLPPNGDTMAPGNSMHWGGGGDLSQNAIGVNRDVLIINRAIALSEYAAAARNLEQFYTALSFPAPN
jgi:Alpha-L-arabinofuranosidase B, catalytic